MAAAGVELTFDIADSAVMGIAEVLASVPAFYRKMDTLRDLARQRRPDAVLLVDFPDFNLRLAKRIHKLSIPIVYYIPPKAWAWRPWRARTVSRLASQVIAIFPFEADFYRRAGANVEFVGHPILDLIPETLTRTQARDRLQQPHDSPLVALLPGSRRKELERLFPAMRASARRIHRVVPGVRFILPLAPSLADTILLETLSSRELPITVSVGQAYEALRAADLAIVASGTATLEAACLGTPMIILYKVSRSTWYIAKWLVHLSHSGLPNIIAGDEIVPELLQDRVQPDRIAAEAIALLLDPETRERQKHALARVRQALGDAGAVERAARLLLETAGVMV